MIDLDERQLSIVKAVLNSVVPDIPVFAFGSRVSGRAKKHSDLDLALEAALPLDWRRMARLREAFEESDLPFRVDVVDWRVCSPQFKAHASPMVALVGRRI